MSVDLAAPLIKGRKQTLNLQFNKMPVFRTGDVPVGSPQKPLNDPGFILNAGYIWNHHIVGSKAPSWPAKTSSPSTSGTSTDHIAPNGDLIAMLPPELRPFTMEPGNNDYGYSMMFNAHRLTPDVRKLIPPIDSSANWISGAINTYPYCFTYGLVCWHAKLSKNKGVDEALWLLPYDLAGTDEIDAMELVDVTGRGIVQTIHNGKLPGGQTAHPFYSATDLTSKDHFFSLDKQPDFMTWYLDGQEVFKIATPDFCKKPFYLLADLEIDKSWQWAGAPLATTTQIDPLRLISMRVWE